MAKPITLRRNFPLACQTASGARLIADNAVFASGTASSRLESYRRINQPRPEVSGFKLHPSDPISNDTLHKRPLSDP
jgi:hypothetical protein